MKKIVYSLIVVASVLILAGCGPKREINPYFNRSTVPASERVTNPADPFADPQMDGNNGEFSIDAAVPDAPGTIEPVADRRWDGVAIYFAYDSAAISTAERAKIEALAEHMKTYANYAVLVEGHCDERGSTEYNRALGETRAIVVKDYLMSLGVDETRIDTVSYGEDKPAVANAQTETEHQKNRRVEFVIGVRRQ